MGISIYSAENGGDDWKKLKLDILRPAAYIMIPKSNRPPKLGQISKALLISALQPYVLKEITEANNNLSDSDTSDSENEND